MASASSSGPQKSHSGAHGNQVSEMVQAHQRTRRAAIPFLVITLSAVAVLIIARMQSYLLFHTLVELISIAIAISIQFLVWNTRNLQENSFLKVLGTGFMAAACLDLLHTLAYKGMPVFPGHGANLAPQLWIAARYIQAFSLLTASLTLRKKVDLPQLMAWAGGGLLVLGWAIFAGYFPDCYREGLGLTKFKMMSEYVIIAIIAASIVVMHRIREQFNPTTYPLILASSLCMVGAEIAFTAYIGVYDLANMAGHIFKLAAYYALYHAIFVTGVQDPFNTLFRELKHSEELLLESRDRVQHEVEERTQELRESRERYRSLFENSPAVMFILDPALGTLVDANAAAVEYYGWTREELLRKGISEINTLPAIEIQAAIKSALNGHGWRREFQHRLADGSVRDVESDTGAVRIGERTMLFTIVHDITERKRAEEATAVLQGQLNHLQRMESIGRLAGGISHDMNNVLAAVMSVAELLRIKGGENIKLYDLILEATKRGRNLLKGLMAFARKEVEDVEFFDLNELVKKEAELLASTMLQRIKLELALAPDIPKMAGAHTALSTALMNLCVNAMDAMPDGGTLTLRTMRLDDENLLLVVQDTGLGMPPEVIARAMEPFYTTKPVGKGTGLGLSMVFGTVQAHGGHVEIRSQVGQGTEVRITLPVTHGERRKLAREAPRAVAEEARKVRVMVVDDDALVREAASGMLEAQGHRVITAGGGYEALGLLEDGFECEVVVLDLNMPNLDGLATLKRLRRLKPELPVLMATGYIDGPTRTRIEALGQVCILSKPYSIDEFRRALAQVF